MVNETRNQNSIWKKLLPIDEAVPLPAFPWHLLPASGRDMIKSLAFANQVDAGMVGGCYLAVLATALSKKIEVDLITHREPVNIYIVNIAQSGERKSSTLREMTCTVYHDPLAGRINVVDDVTTEALADLMADNDERISIISAEGGIFSIISGLYTERNPNIDIFLKGHSGDFWSCHRIGRDPKRMQHPALTMCLCVQPDVIKEVCSNKRFRGRGLLARFLYCHCGSNIGQRKRHHVTIPPALKIQYEEHIQNLMKIPFTPQPHIITLDRDAHKRWDIYYDNIENEMKPGRGLANITDWGSKLPGAVARIAGLLHMAEHGETGLIKPISAGIVGAACKIGTYYKKHAVETFRLMGNDPALGFAKKIVEYIYAQRPQYFKGRDVLANKNAFKSMEEVNAGVRVLARHQYLREVITAQNKRGRPQAAVYEVNPQVYSQ